MTTILIVESNPIGFQPAAPDFTSVLQDIDRSVDIRIVAPYDAPFTDADLQGTDGAIFTGSAVVWGVDAPEAAPLRAVMERVFAAHIPSYGSCNGMQMAAYVLGGASQPSPNGREDGLARDIRLTEAGQTHPFLTGRRSVYAVPCIHLHEVTRLPDRAVLLAGNAHSPVQAFAYDDGATRFWGVQYHPEVTPHAMANVLEAIGGYPQSLCDDLRLAGTDAGAARRLGVAPGDLQPDQRVTEIRNWFNSLSA
ncbi:type 1 glutamine amidotransferase [Nioella aestuarii]|uniref:type 1 glutamine amidotransferase n=1 Tax=Nioella aestuarii TaxID=1662864 RepID=UPI003D7F3603